MISKLKAIAEKDEKIRMDALTRIFQFIRGETSLEIDKIKKNLQSEIDYLTEENTNLAIELNETKRKH